MSHADDLVAGLWSGHDASFAVFDDGKPLIHCEYERFLRLKEPKGDSADFFLKNFEDAENVRYFTSVYPNKLNLYKESFNKINKIIEKNKGKLYLFGHHQAHAANAFFSSNFDEATIITLDGGGIEENKKPTACTIWYGKNNKIAHIKTFNLNEINIGGLWTRGTRYIFKLSSGFPDGHSAGSVMALSAWAKNPTRFKKDFDKMLREDLVYASFKPAGQPDSVYEGKDPKHPYLNRFRELIENEGEETEFDMSASLQLATEELVKEIVFYALSNSPCKTHLCFSGGVSLNAVCFGKLQYENWFPSVKEVYAPPTPHDGGLTLGSCQYLWHHILNKPRKTWNGNFTPYLGKKYSKEEILSSLKKYENKISIKNSNDDEVINYLNNEKVIAVFNGSAESGRRALGNRTILAHPAKDGMKERLNFEKNRQHYRPFAGSVLREDVSTYFKCDFENPYMSFVAPFKDEYKDIFKTLYHPDHTNRFQSVRKEDNEWYYNFIKKWKEKTGFGIIVNTSFNLKEPINENVEHSIDCLLRSTIDFLYLPELELLISKNEKS